MNDRLTALGERRAALLARAAHQRNDLALAAAPLRSVFSAADQGVAIVNFLRRRPVLLAAGIAAAVLLRPAFFLQWLKRGMLVWEVSLTLKRMLSKR